MRSVHAPKAIFILASIALFGALLTNCQGTNNKGPRQLTLAVNSGVEGDALKFMPELGKYAPPGYASFNADEVSAHLLPLIQSRRVERRA